MKLRLLTGVLSLIGLLCGLASQVAAAQDNPKKQECPIQMLWDADTPLLPAANPFGLEGDARKLRFTGVDAPERCDQCPEGRSAADCPNENCACRAATRALQKMIDDNAAGDGTTVVELTGELDDYGRSLGRLLLRQADGTVIDPALELLRSGLAVPFFKGNDAFFKRNPDYLKATVEAIRKSKISDATWRQLRNVPGKDAKGRNAWVEGKLKDVKP